MDHDALYCVLMLWHCALFLYMYWKNWKKIITFVYLNQTFQCTIFLVLLQVPSIWVHSEFKEMAKLHTNLLIVGTKIAILWQTSDKQMKNKRRHTQPNWPCLHWSRRSSAGGLCCSGPTFSWSAAHGSEQTKRQEWHISFMLHLRFMLMGSRG